LGARMTLVEDFRRLHAAGVLVLPNAWDAASARIVERAGAAAVATTSGAVAWSLGVPDGDRLPLDLLAGAVARMAAAVAVPVTADVESGGPDVAATVRAVLDGGAVGINIEDSGNSAEEHADRIGLARETGGPALFVNARTDLYLFGIGDPDARLADTIRRGRLYAEAGADGIFVPGVVDPAVLRVLAAEIPLPLNALTGPGAPPVAELAAAGVRRVSVGTGLAEAAYGAADRAARELLATGTYAALEGGLSYGDLQKLLD
jgi:2-methylisocitrate lyase-like PEP mutase family enzyme